MWEICVDQPKDRLPKIVITFDLVLGLCYRIWCEYFSACCINQHKKIHSRLYARQKNVVKSKGDKLCCRGDYQQFATVQLRKMLVRQDHKNDVFHKDCLSQSTNPILNQVGGYNRQLKLKTVWKKKDKNIKANPGTTFFKLRLLNDKEHIYTERSGVPNFDLAGVYYRSNVRAITRYHLHLRPVLGFILSCVPNFSVLLKTQNL